MGTTRAARSALATALLLTAAPAAAACGDELRLHAFWLGARGHVGLSHLWFDRHADRWKQVGQDRTTIEDRTTLTLDAPGRVRQRIEISSASTQSRSARETRDGGPVAAAE